MNGENESEYKVLVKKKPDRKRDTCVDVKIIFVFIYLVKVSSSVTSCVTSDGIVILNNESESAAAMIQTWYKSQEHYCFSQIAYKYSQRHRL